MTLLLTGACVGMLIYLDERPYTYMSKKEILFNEKVGIGCFGFSFILGALMMTYLTRQFIRYKALLEYTSLKEFLKREVTHKYQSKGLKMLLKVNNDEGEFEKVKYSYKVQHPYLEMIQIQTSETKKLVK
jgi:hypothetical protein